MPAIHVDNFLREKIRQEWMILRRVYDINNYPNKNIKKTETPDFEIKTADAYIGVEVTNYFQNKTSGRYNNDSKYRNLVLDELICAPL